MDEIDHIEREKDIQRGEKYRHRVIVILTTIGLWLALPATCGLIQRIVDMLSGMKFFSENAAMAFRLATDLCLLGFYFVGFIILILVGFSGWVLFSAWDWAWDKSPKAMQGVKNFQVTQSILGRIKSWLPKREKVTSNENDKNDK